MGSCNWTGKLSRRETVFCSLIGFIGIEG